MIKVYMQLQSISFEGGIDVQWPPPNLDHYCLYTEDPATSLQTLIGCADNCAGLTCQSADGTVRSQFIPQAAGTAINLETVEYVFPNNTRVDVSVIPYNGTGSELKCTEISGVDNQFEHFGILSGVDDDTTVDLSEVGGLNQIIPTFGLGGCTDELACNYDSNATSDNGSCEHPLDNYDCDGNCLVDVDCSGECGGDTVVDYCGDCGGDAFGPGTGTMDYCGCCPGTDSPYDHLHNYCNTDITNGACTGCADGSACNNGESYFNDGEDCFHYRNDPTDVDSIVVGTCTSALNTVCDYAAAGFDCDGNCVLDIDCSGECGGSAVVDDCGVCGGSAVVYTWTGSEAGLLCNCDEGIETFFDCAGNCVCTDSWTNITSHNNVCGDTSPYDCVNVCGGDAEIDDCGDCYGGWAGGSENSADLGCGCDVGAPTNYWEDSDGDGLGSGDSGEYCPAHGEPTTDNSSDRPNVYPAGWVTNGDDNYPDCSYNYYACSGVCGGEAYYDTCGVCICNGDEDGDAPSGGFTCEVEEPNFHDDGCGCNPSNLDTLKPTDYWWDEDGDGLGTPGDATSYCPSLGTITSLTCDFSDFTAGTNECLVSNNGNITCSQDNPCWVTNQDDVDFPTCYNNGNDCNEECLDTGTAELDLCGICSGGGTGYVANSSDVGCGCGMDPTQTYYQDFDCDGVGSGDAYTFCPQHGTITPNSGNVDTGVFTHDSVLDQTGCWSSSGDDSDDNCYSGELDCAGDCTQIGPDADPAVDGLSYYDSCGVCVSDSSEETAYPDLTDCGCFVLESKLYYPDNDGDGAGDSTATGVRYCPEAQATGDNITATPSYDVVPDGYVDNNTDSNDNCNSDGYDCEQVCTQFGPTADPTVDGLAVIDECGVCRTLGLADENWNAGDQGCGCGANPPQTYWVDEDNDTLGTPDTEETYCPSHGTLTSESGDIALGTYDTPNVQVQSGYWVTNGDDLYPNCASNTVDCEGTCDGSVEIDGCGICGGLNASDLGCGCGQLAPTNYWEDVDGDGLGAGCPTEYCPTYGGTELGPNSADRPDEAPSGWVNVCANQINDGDGGCNNECTDDAEINCPTNNTDCWGVCNGPAIKDDCDVCRELGATDPLLNTTDLGCGCGQAAPAEYCDDTGDGDGNGEPGTETTYCPTYGGTDVGPNSSDRPDEVPDGWVLNGEGTCNDLTPSCDGPLDCNSDCNGTAFFDDCGICSEGDSGHIENSDDIGCGCFVTTGPTIYCEDTDVDGLGNPGTETSYCYEWGDPTPNSDSTNDGIVDTPLLPAPTATTVRLFDIMTFRNYGNQWDDIKSTGEEALDGFWYNGPYGVTDPVNGRPYNRDSNSTQSGNTGPSIGGLRNDNVNYDTEQQQSGQYYVYPEVTNNTNKNFLLRTPRINLSLVPIAPKLIFYFHATGDQIGTLTIKYGTNGNMNTVSYNSFVELSGSISYYTPGGWVYGQDNISGEVHTSQNDPWYRAEVDLSSLTSLDGYILFDYNNPVSGNQGDFALENIFIEGGSILTQWVEDCTDPAIDCPYQEVDCNGDCGGTLEGDECGVCDGGNNDDLGCGCFAGEPVLLCDDSGDADGNGDPATETLFCTSVGDYTSKYTDEERPPFVGDFGGQGAGAWVLGPAGAATCNDDYNDCAGAVVDCNLECGGDAYLDECNDCVGGTTDDGTGIPYVENYRDLGCGCGALAPKNYCYDSDGDGNGNPPEVNFCATHGTITSNSINRPGIAPSDWVDAQYCDDLEPSCVTNDTDCNGDCGGTAVIDDCLVCSEGNSGHVANSDNVGCGCFEGEATTYYEDTDGDGLGADPGVTYCAILGALGDASYPVVPNTDCSSPPCWVDNNLDELVDCPHNFFDCNGNCVPEEGASTLDDCGECNTPANQNAAQDLCGTCFGDCNPPSELGGTAQGCPDGAGDYYCDCDLNYFDCAGVCGGNSVDTWCDGSCGETGPVLDECGDCGGDGANSECPDPDNSNYYCIDVIDICGSGSLTTTDELEYCSCECHKIDECGNCVDPQCETTDSGAVFWTTGKNPCDGGYFPTNTGWNRECLGCTEEGPASNANCNYNPDAIVDDGTCQDSQSTYGQSCSYCSDTPDTGFCNCIGWEADCDGACNETTVSTLDSQGNCCPTATILTYYPDIDGDGFGENVNSITVCAGYTPPPNYVLNNLDCIGADGAPAVIDACGECNPDVINSGCTGCKDNYACNTHVGCSYKYWGADGNAIIVNECLFEDNSQCEYPLFCQDCNGDCLTDECVAGCDDGGDNLCGNNLVLDECGDCGGDNSNCLDCAGVPNGTSTLDDCGICDGGNVDDGTGFITGPNADCAGNCSGTAFIDGCGVCSGGLSEHVAESDRDDCNVCFGGHFEADNEPFCGEALGADNCCDCNGTPYGIAFFDTCGVCSGGTSDHTENSDVDCAGVCFGSAVLGGCFNTCNGTEVEDECGVCGGDGIIEGLCDCAGTSPEDGFDCDGVCIAGFDCNDECGGSATFTTCWPDVDGDGLGNGNLDSEEQCTEGEICNAGWAPNTLDASDECVFPSQFYTCDNSAPCGGGCDTPCYTQTICGPNCGGTGCDLTCTDPVDNFYDCFNNYLGGCTDELACNYDSQASVDNASCTYPADDGSGTYLGNLTDGDSTIFNCAGECVVDTDCAGVCNGSSTVDLCGVCDGSINSSSDCTSFPLSCCDCAGTPNGTADFDCAGNCPELVIVDDCGVCDGGVTDITNCEDCLTGYDLGCDGNCWPQGTEPNIDLCGVCGGDNSTCLGCDGVPNSGQVVDCNGVCNGSALIDECETCSGGTTNIETNSECTGCMESEALNYDSTAIVPCNNCCTFNLETEFPSDYIESGKQNFIGFTLPPTDNLMCAGTYGFATAADEDCVGKSEGDACTGTYNDYDFDATGVCAQYEITRTLNGSIFSQNPDTIEEQNLPTNLFIDGDKIYTVQNNSTEPDYQGFCSYLEVGDSGIWAPSGTALPYFEIGKGYTIKTSANMWLKWQKLL